MGRILIGDTVELAVRKMGEGNPGALRVLVACVQLAAAIDPDAALASVAPLFWLDELEVYGSDIWMLYKDVCREDLRSMIAVLRGWQLGFISREQIAHAVENYGEGIDVAEIFRKVEEHLVGFQRAQRSDGSN